MKKIGLLLLLISLSSASFLMADTPTTVSTFHSIGIYWSPDGGADSLQVFVKFQEEGTTAWKEGYPMKYYPISGTTKDLADYRGSIVNLAPNTTYEIELTLQGTSTTETITAKTWTENFPITKTIKVGNLNRQYNVLESGTEDGYILIDGTGSTIDVENDTDFCIDVKGNYIIIRGFTLKNARECGINLMNNHDVIIENCDISGWGQEDKDGFGKNYQAAIYSTNGKGVPSTLKRIVVQRCKIHHPRWDANNWSEYRDGHSSYHPRGSQAIAFYNSAGNHVFRYNTMWTDDEHMFNDVIGFGSNASYEGFPNCDSDIYGNYFANCWDDGIESEGANRNVRIWGNYIENVLIPIANAATSIGPLYIWKNTSGRSYTPPGSQVTGQYGAFIKMGHTNAGESWMSGATYLFNNTVLQPQSSENKDDGAGGIGAHYGSDRKIRHCVTRNNILHVRKYDHSISVRPEFNTDFNYDYDLCNGGYPSGYEVHGVNGTPVYVDGASFDYTNMTANFFLSSSSPGVDVGEVIPNFADKYEGSAPDMGAFETGDSPMEYGVDAYLVTGINDKELVNSETPSDFYLSQNYPNPFNPTTVISYGVSQSGFVTIKVFNVLGQEVATLVNKNMNTGNYQIDFNAGNLPSGIYIYSIQSGKYVSSKKMLLIK